MSAILYSFRRCPYAMRARMALSVSCTEYEHREVVLRDKPKAMIETSPKGTVPVFVTAHGTVIDESLELMLWALSQNDPRKWMDCDRDVATALIACNDGPFKYHLDRYKYASRYDDAAQRGDVDIDHRTLACEFIATLEEYLTKTPYLLGHKQTYADIAIFPFIRQFANADRSWWDSNAYNQTRNWLDQHVESDLFKSVMKKFPQWSPKT